MRLFTNKWHQLVLTIALLFCNLVHSEPLLSSSFALEQLKILAGDDMQGRKVPSQGYDRAKQHILNAYQQYDLNAFPEYSNFIQTFIFGSKQLTGSNIIGYLSGAKYPDKFIVITAHYDHLGIKGSRIFNGANDNASGVATLLTLMKHFSASPPLYSLVFVATDAEELGLYGAKHLAKNLPMPAPQVLLNINVDMIGDGGRRNTLFYATSRKVSWLKEQMELIRPKLQTDSFRLRKFRSARLRRAGSAMAVDWSNVSDHAAFKKAGIPYVYFGAQANKVYHTAKDDFAHIKQPFFLASVAAIIKIVEQLQYLEINEQGVIKGADKGNETLISRNPSE